MLELSHFSSGFTGGKLTVINLPRMRRKVTVVVWSVRLCVTANLGIHTVASSDGYQWHYRGMAIINKKFFF